MRADFAVAFEERKSRDHGVNWGELVLSAKWGEDGTSSDGGVEAFAETFLRSGVEVA